MDLLSSRPADDNPIENCCKKLTIFDVAIASLLLVGVFLLLFAVGPSMSVDKSTWITSYNPLSHPLTFNMTVYIDELDEVLAGVSDINKTVIITVVNKAYAEGDKPMLDLFLDGFWLGNDTQDLINHLLVVALDKTSFERCRFLRLRCYKLETDGVDFAGEELYMSEDFIKMMWRRTSFLGDVLRRGYNFVFTDTDIVWLRNPFPELIKMGDIDDEPDFQISTDRFNGDEWSKTQDVNTGFFMVRSNNKTVALLETWYGKRNTSQGMKEQDVLQAMIREGIIFNHLGLKTRFLNTLFFSGFCQDSKDVQNVITVHANCCRTISAKLADLTAVLHRWKAFKSSKDQLDFHWSVPHSACVESWK
ncbi:uncharacterized protein At1g28695-like [Impatiens glandulifera]|uniref:uncharacterized protein At1g28695-like n=1 Tax=Impatiens glandulifera TaxID=253017 RepID=UPI001FB162E9|nr:uncharacterized protein At1g28695-like [Impatiens glandulifera]